MLGDLRDGHVESQNRMIRAIEGSLKEHNMPFAKSKSIFAKVQVKGIVSHVINNRAQTCVTDGMGVDEIRKFAYSPASRTRDRLSKATTIVSQEIIIHDGCLEAGSVQQIR